MVETPPDLLEFNPKEVLGLYGKERGPIQQAKNVERIDLEIPSSTWEEMGKKIISNFNRRDQELESGWETRERKDLMPLFEPPEVMILEGGRKIQLSASKILYKALDQNLGIENKRMQSVIQIRDLDNNQEVCRFKIHTPYEDEAEFEPGDSTQLIDRLVLPAYRGNRISGYALDNFIDPLLKAEAKRKQRIQTLEIDSPDPFVIKMGIKAGMSPNTEEDIEKLRRIVEADEDLKLMSLRSEDRKDVIMTRQNIPVEVGQSYDDFRDMIDTEELSTSLKISKEIGYEIPVETAVDFLKRVEEVEQGI